MDLHRALVRFVLLFGLATIVLVASGLAPVARAADATYALETAVDPWIPFLIWGALLVFCLWLAGEAISAWFPAAMALMNLLESLLPVASNVYGRESAIMLFVFAFMVHSFVVLVRNVIRRKSQ